MIAVRLLAVGALVLFLTLTWRAVAAHGYLGFFAMAGATAATRLLLLDLAVGLVLASIWLVVDARRRGVRSWPFLVLTALLGSAGPLAYLALRRRRRAR
jgi:hypothetical protein